VLAEDLGVRSRARVRAASTNLTPTLTYLLTLTLTLTLNLTSTLALTLALAHLLIRHGLELIIVRGRGAVRVDVRHVLRSDPW